jgi:hypothetical protein
MSRDEAAKLEILNRVAAIQAAAEILHDNGDLPHNERHVFLKAINHEAARLSRLIKKSCMGAIAVSVP